MKKGLLILTAFVVIGFGSAAVISYAAEYNRAKSPETTAYFERSYDVNELMGLKVNNEQGETLGKITDFIADSRGHIAFAILSRGGILGIGDKLVAVPFDALSYDSPGRFFVLNMTKEKLASAPEYKTRSDLANSKAAEDNYKFFGVRPYWTEESSRESQSGTDRKTVGAEPQMRTESQTQTNEAPRTGKETAGTESQGQTNETPSPSH